MGESESRSDLRAHTVGWFDALDQCVEDGWVGRGFTLALRPGIDEDGRKRLALDNRVPTTPKNWPLALIGLSLHFQGDE